MRELFNKIFSFRTLCIISVIFIFIFAFAFYLGIILGKDTDFVLMLFCFCVCQFEFLCIVENIFSHSDKIENNKIKEAKNEISI